MWVKIARFKLNIQVELDRAAAAESRAQDRTVFSRSNNVGDNAFKPQTAHYPHCTSNCALLLLLYLIVNSSLPELFITAFPLTAFFLTSARIGPLNFILCPKKLLFVSYNDAICRFY